MTNIHFPRYDLQLEDKQARLQRIKAQVGVSGTATLVTLAGNSKSTNNVADGVALSASTTAVGTWEMAQGDGVTTSTLSDQSGTLYFDFSNDEGSSHTTFPTNGFAVAANIHEYHRAAVNGRFYRYRFVAGATAVTNLRHHTYYGPHTHPSAPVNQTLGSDADAMVVRPYSTQVDLALGRLGGVTAKDKFGYIDGLSSGITLGTESSWVDVWAFGGQRTAPTGSFTAFMASDSSADVSSEVTLTYLDVSGVEQTTAVITQGTTSFTAIPTATEVYRGFVSNNVELSGNVAVATANNFTAGVPSNQEEVLIYIAPIDNQTQLAAFRVPSDKQCILTEFNVTFTRASGAAASAIVALEARNSGGVFRTLRRVEVGAGAPLSRDMNIVLSPSTDVRARIRDVSDTNCSMSVVFEYLLVDV